MEQASLNTAREAAHRLVGAEHGRRRAEAEKVEALCDLAAAYDLDDEELFLEVLIDQQVAVVGAVGEIVDLFLNPANGIFREDRRCANFAGLVTDNQLVVFYPDGAFCQVMGQRQRATHRDRLVHVLLVHFGVMLRALGTDRRLDDMHQRHFMRLNARAQSIQFQRCHKIILVESRLNLCSEHSAARRRAARVQQAVCPERYRAD